MEALGAVDDEAVMVDPASISMAFASGWPAPPTEN
jgi:hypothetical protein